MGFPLINTERCQLRQAVKDDASWMLRLFNDKEVVEYIEGITWFNTNVDSVMSFIVSMERNYQNSRGILWCVIINNHPAGIIMANDLEENPYLTFALFEEYRGVNIGSEIFNAVNKYVTHNFGKPEVESKNPIVKKITRRKSEYLFIGNYYYSTLSELKDTLSKINLKNRADKNIIEDILSVYRDGTLTNWLYYLAQKGEEEALNAISSLHKLSVDAGDRNLLLGMSKILCPEGNVVLNSDISSLIRISPTAFISYPSNEIEVNIFHPIHLETSVTNCKLAISFDILQSSLDNIDVEVDGNHSNLHLSTKKKRVTKIFPITIKGTEEELINIMLDGSIFHRIKFQKYPNKEWDNRACTLEGVRNLYAQDYKKALLCFNRYKTAADLFWLGIMEYIGFSGEPRPNFALEYFEMASLSEDTSWSCYADVFRAIMAFKGEGCVQDLDFAANLIAKYPDSVDVILLLKKAISGQLKHEEYDNLFYSYNISDRNPTPKMFAESRISVINPKYLLDISSPFNIVVDAETSATIKQTLVEDETLHAYIGVTTARNGDWQYTITNDWNTNASYNTFEYDIQSGCYRLEIANLKALHKIASNEKVLHLNLILRNTDGSKQFPPDGSHYSIDCLIQRSHIALCNITRLFFKFPEIKSMLEISLNYEFYTQANP